MTEGHYQEIKDFATNLSTLREQASDRGLLDFCQLYLNELLDLSKDNALEPDPAQAGASQ